MSGKKLMTQDDLKPTHRAARRQQVLHDRQHPLRYHQPQSRVLHCADAAHSQADRPRILGGCGRVSACGQSAVMMADE